MGMVCNSCDNTLLQFVIMSTSTQVHEYSTSSTQDESLLSSENQFAKNTNTAFVLSPTRQFCYEQRPIPELPTPRHIRVGIVATGLCGSDVCYRISSLHRILTNASN